VAGRPSCGGDLPDITLRDARRKILRAATISGTPARWGPCAIQACFTWNNGSPGCFIRHQGVPRGTSATRPARTLGIIASDPGWALLFTPLLDNPISLWRHASARRNFPGARRPVDLCRDPRRRIHQTPRRQGRHCKGSHSATQRASPSLGAHRQSTAWDRISQPIPPSGAAMSPRGTIIPGRAALLPSSWSFPHGGGGWFVPAATPTSNSIAPGFRGKRSPLATARRPMRDDRLRPPQHSMRRAARPDHRTRPRGLSGASLELTGRATRTVRSRMGRWHTPPAAPHRSGIEGDRACRPGSGRRHAWPGRNPLARTRGRDPDPGAAGARDQHTCLW
jgi:hypothetical protein